MKQKAKESFIKELTTSCTDENIDINLHLLSDKELKELYLKLQAVKSGRLSYGIAKDEDFITTMKNGKLQFISFTDTYKFGVRRLTFKEYLLFCEFADKHQNMYTFL
jgi:hypothetical protein